MAPRAWPAVLLLLLSPLSGAQEFEASADRAVSNAAAPTLSGLPPRADLSHHFADGPRVQGRLNSCHSFVAVALLESAYFRRHGRTIRLSEADLFVRGRARGLLRGRETGMLRPAVRLALDGGVIPGDLYAELTARWPEFRTKALKILRGRESVVEELLPESATPEADAAREKVRAELAGFEMGGDSFLRFAGNAARSAWKKGAVRCDAERVAKLLERKLAAGIPVGVGLLSGWAPSEEWRRDSDDKGAHYFTVIGYERGAAGTVFKTRNTWSVERGGSPALSGADLCEIFAMTWVAEEVIPRFTAR
ncbi:MAG: hypothetical protein M0D55_11575 [Elusimicrobiota bacterium]|nr:MAG: hypothetical protein M0D55_11575 [Elusimicrobiota bacterium]